MSGSSHPTTTDGTDSTGLATEEWTHSLFHHKTRKAALAACICPCYIYTRIQQRLASFPYPPPSSTALKPTTSKPGSSISSIRAQSTPGSSSSSDHQQQSRQQPSLPSKSLATSTLFCAQLCCIPSFFIRGTVRSAFSIKGSRGADCLAAVACLPCALAQMDKDVAARADEVLDERGRPRRRVEYPRYADVDAVGGTAGRGEMEMEMVLGCGGDGEVPLLVLPVANMKMADQRQEMPEVEVVGYGTRGQGMVYAPPSPRRVRVAGRRSKGKGRAVKTDSVIGDDEEADWVDTSSSAQASIPSRTSGQE